MAVPGAPCAHSPAGWVPRAACHRPVSTAPRRGGSAELPTPRLPVFPARAPRAASGLGDFRSVWPPGRWMPACVWGAPSGISWGAPRSGPFGKRCPGLRLPCQAVKGPCVPCWRPARSQIRPNVAAVTPTEGLLRPCWGSAVSLARVEGGTRGSASLLLSLGGLFSGGQGGLAPVAPLPSRREKRLQKPQRPRPRPLAWLHLPLSSSAATHHPFEPGPGGTGRHPAHGAHTVGAQHAVGAQQTPAHAGETALRRACFCKHQATGCALGRRGRTREPREVPGAAEACRFVLFRS